MPPHLARIAPPRLLCHVLADLKEAKRDEMDALADFDDPEDADASDRAAEADQRLETLRDEFAARFREATGLTWREVEAAVSEAVL